MTNGVRGIYLRLLAGLIFVALVLFVYFWIISFVAGSDPLFRIVVAIPLILLFYWLEKRFNILSKFNAPDYEKRKKIDLYFKGLTQTDTFKNFVSKLHLSSSDIEVLKSRVEEFLLSRSDKSISLFLNNHLDNQGHIRTKGDDDFMFVWVIRTLRSVLRD